MKKLTEYPELDPCLISVSKHVVIIDEYDNNYLAYYDFEDEEWKLLDSDDELMEECDHRWFDIPCWDEIEKD